MKPSTCARRSCRRITTRPLLSAALTANTFFAKSIPIVVTSISDPPRFVRMLLSTSWAHYEAVYKRAGVHTISRSETRCLRFVANAQPRPRVSCSALRSPASNEARLPGRRRASLPAGVRGPCTEIQRSNASGMINQAIADHNDHGSVKLATATAHSVQPILAAFAQWGLEIALRRHARRGRTATLNGSSDRYVGKLSTTSSCSAKRTCARLGQADDRDGGPARP